MGSTSSPLIFLLGQEVFLGVVPPSSPLDVPLDLTASVLCNLLGSTRWEGSGGVAFPYPCRNDPHSESMTSGHSAPVLPGTRWRPQATVQFPSPDRVDRAESVQRVDADGIRQRRGWRSRWGSREEKLQEAQPTLRTDFEGPCRRVGLATKRTDPCDTSLSNRFSRLCPMPFGVQEHAVDADGHRAGVLPAVGKGTDDRSARRCPPAP